MSAGYRNPPNASQFKKGRAGNSKGRPKRAMQISTAYLFRKVANEQVAIEVEGGQAMMTRWEAFVRQIHTMASTRMRALRDCSISYESNSPEVQPRATSSHLSLATMS
jgi:Family of unknown function (DUF5681)